MTAHSFRQIGLPALLAFAVLAPMDAKAQQIDLQVGAAGHLRLGQWTPIEVTGIESDRVAILASDPTGVLVEWPLTQDGDRYVGSVQIANPSSRCLIVAGEAKTPVAAFVPEKVASTHELSDRLWLSVPGGLGFEAAAATYNGAKSTIRATDVSLDDLAAVQSVDGLGVFNVIAIAKSVDSETSERLRQWVAAGGHLLIVGGYDADGTASPVPGDWLPIDVEGPARFRDLNVLETAIPGGRNLRVKRPLEGVKLSTDSGIESVKSSFGPLIVRAPYGFGRVTALAFDLASPVLQSWNSLDALCLVLADDLPATSRQRQSQAKLTTTGVSELSTQILSQVDATNGVGRSKPDIWSILGRLAIYALIVSAIDRFLVHRVLRSPQLTWITLPLWTAGAFYVFALAAPAGATSSNAESEVELSVRSVNLLDIDDDAGFSRQSSWASVGSTQRRRVTISLQPEFASTLIGPAGASLAERVRLGWAAAPEETFGGLYRDRQVGTNGERSLVTTNRETISEVPFLPRGTRTYQTAASGFTQGASRSLSFDLSLRGTRPIGTITNNLPTAISDWSLAVGRLLIDPAEGQKRTLEPGESFEVDLGSCRMRALRDVLTGIQRLQIKEGESDKHIRSVAEQQPYDPTSSNVTKTLLTATFFETAGGESYTGLRNSGSPASLDLSHVLAFDRIVFFGELEHAGQPVRCDGDAESIPSRSFLRVVSTLP